MTLLDLVKIYRAAFWGVKRAEDDGDSAGIRAVVTALRDEFGRIMEPSDDWNRMGIVDVFNEILASDGVKSGTHGSPELDEDARKSISAAIHAAAGGKR
jgi:hypothetical protein